MDHPALTRRRFLRVAAASAAGAAAAPYVITSSALGGAAGVPPASERVALAHIGVGGQGSGLLGHFLGLGLGQSVAVCDCFQSRREKAAQRVEAAYTQRGGGGSYKGCTSYADFREVMARGDIDAVVIATPDHWHVPLGLAAARSGKDMYIEKPLGLAVEWDKALRQAVRRYGRVFQYGTQQRGQAHIRLGCELVVNGRIGKVTAVDVVAPDGAVGGSTVPIPVPEGFDYDRWLGPAQASPYTADRCTSSGSWHVYDNSIGFLGGWGAHPLDVLHWGYPDAIPAEYEGRGFISSTGLFSTVVHWDIKGRYANGVPFTLKPGGDSTKFTGTEGWIRLSRGGWDAEPKSLLKAALGAGDVRLHASNDHKRDFLECVKSRQDPASHIDTACQSDFISHLSDIAVRTGRRIVWDPVKETIVGDEDAARMLARPMRAPWRL
ncbi:MAG: Gfo/Idh/MocA family oxidoreductase [Planctomycetes bacterium]|nr:Gfo/Idh/MocA family oxidoreductase [Planctomycetota bacterium]